MQASGQAGRGAGRPTLREGDSLIDGKGHIIRSRPVRPPGCGGHRGSNPSRLPPPPVDYIGVRKAEAHEQITLEARMAAVKAASPVTPANQEDEMPKPWEAKGISRATWYRKREIGAAEIMPETETETAACETETVSAEPTETAETVRQACETETPSHVPVLDETAPETMQPPADAAVLAENAEDQGVHHRDQVSRKSTDQPWRISEADAARRADRYRAARKDKGELIATRVLRWELQDAGVLYEQLEREVDRIRALAASRH
jgi:hypothetical protein